MKKDVPVTSMTGLFHFSKRADFGLGKQERREIEDGELKNRESRTQLGNDDG